MSESSVCLDLFPGLERQTPDGHHRAAALASVLETRRPVVVEDLDLPGGAWPEPTTQAVTLSLFSQTQTSAGLIVLGCQLRSGGDRYGHDQVPEVALIDIGMPGMDGYEVARRLHQSPGLKDMALVAITGYTSGSMTTW